MQNLDDKGANERASRDRDLFNRIAKAYCSKDLKPAQRLARAHRLHQSLAAIGSKPGISVLEVGCGAGFSAAYLKGHYHRYSGVDHSAALIAYAQRHNAEPKATFVRCDISSFIPEQQFDLIFMIGVLHHLPNPIEVLRRLRSFLEPEGMMVVNEPQNSNPLISVTRAVRTWLDKDYSADQVQYSEHDLRDMFQQAGYLDIQITPQGVFSTPFAELITPLQSVTTPLSRVSCSVDAFLERTVPGILRHISWNLVAAGRNNTGDCT